jgi:hypothetical protein
MAAIALAESSGNPNAVNNDANGTQDRGLWQINSVHGFSNSFDPGANAQQAVSVEQSQGLGAWSTYTGGEYKNYLQSGVAPSTNAQAASYSPGPGSGSPVGTGAPPTQGAAPTGGGTPPATNASGGACKLNVGPICMDTPMGIVAIGGGVTMMIVALVLFF